MPLFQVFAGYVLAFFINMQVTLSFPINHCSPFICCIVRSVIRCIYVVLLLSCSLVWRRVYHKFTYIFKFLCRRKSAVRVRVLSLPAIWSLLLYELISSDLLKTTQSEIFEMQYGGTASNLKNSDIQLQRQLLGTIFENKIETFQNLGSSFREIREKSKIAVFHN